MIDYSGINILNNLKIIENKYKFNNIDLIHIGTYLLISVKNNNYEFKLEATKK